MYQLNSPLNLATTQIHFADELRTISIQKREKSVLEILVANPPADAEINQQVQENLVKARGAIPWQKQMIQRKCDGKKPVGVISAFTNLGFQESLG